MKLSRLLLVVIFVFVAFSSSYASCAELKDGSIVPAIGANVGVNAGDTAPDLALEDLNGNLKHISFKRTPVIMISMYGLNADVNKVKQLANLYSKRKDIKLLFVVRSEVEFVKEFMLKHDLDIPVYFDRKKEFSIKYNAAVPSMVIVDKNGIVRYNNTYWIDINSLDGFIRTLISGNGDHNPQLLYSSAIAKREVPKLINIGEKVPADVFRDLEGSPVKLEFKGKPTVIFYWMSFTNEKFLSEMIPVMQSVYNANKDKADFYTINGSGDRRTTMNILDRHDSSVPALVGGEFLQYSRVFPVLVIIDKNGVIRYRPDRFPNAEELEVILTKIID